MRFPSEEEQRGVGGGPREEPGSEVRCELASRATAIRLEWVGRKGSRQLYTY